MKKQHCAWKKRITAFALVFALLLSMVPASTGSAAKKVSLSKKKLTIKVGKTKKLKLKNNKKKVKWKVVSGKKKIKLKAKKKTGVKIVAKKKGKAKVQAKVGKKKYTCKITVKGKAASDDGSNSNSSHASTTASGQPSGTADPDGSGSGSSGQNPDGSSPTEDPGGGGTSTNPGGGGSSTNPGGGSSSTNPGGGSSTQPTQSPSTQPTQDPTQSGGSIDLGGKTAFQFGSKQLALGISRADVLKAIGSATRTEKSPQGFDVIVYNPGGTYNGYTLIYLKNDVVVSLCAVGTAGTVSYGNLVKTGDAASTLTAGKGWVGESWFEAKESDNASKDGEGAYRCTDTNVNATVLAYVDCYKRNQVYCIQAFSNTMSMEEMVSSSKCRYDTEILNAIKLETAELLIAYRIACGYSATQYPLKAIDGLSKVAQDYLNRCPIGSDNPPGEQDATALKAAVLTQNGNDVPLYFAQITMAGNSDSIGFANCILERKEMSEYIAKLSYLAYSPAGQPYKYWYQYLGIAATSDGNGHSYMVIDLVDRWYNSDPRWYGSDDDDDGWE